MYFFLIFFSIVKLSFADTEGSFQVYIPLATEGEIETLFQPCSMVPSISNYSNVVKGQGYWIIPLELPKPYERCITDSALLRYNWTHWTSAACCVSHRKSVCDVHPSSTRVMCNNTVLNNIRDEAICHILVHFCWSEDCYTVPPDLQPPPGGEHPPPSQDFNLNNCMSTSSKENALASEYRDNYCVVLLQDSGYLFDEVTSSRKKRNADMRNADMTDSISEDKEEALTSALLNYRNYLCIGTIASNIDRVLKPAIESNRTPSYRSVNNILYTLDATFEEDFNLNWANRRFRDTQEVVENTEGTLQVLVDKLTNEVEDIKNFTFRGNQMEFHVMKVEVAKQKIYQFPSDENRLNSTLLGQISASIPLQNACSKYESDSNCTVVVGIAVIDNFLDYILETMVNYNLRNSSSGKGDSVLLSIIIQSAHGRIRKFEDESLKLSFTPKMNLSNSSDYQGNFLETSRLAWNASGLNTQVSPDGKIIVESSHLTSFAILVSPTGIVSSTNDNEGDGEKSIRSTEQIVQDIISYIGCSISIISLAIAIWCLLTFGKKLKKGVLLYVHLNLCVSLLMALVVFVLGVDLAQSNNVFCIIVASSIQYFFLCMFMWMLGEGILLYALLVKVFVNVDKNWRLLIPLCWGLPLPLVAVSAGVLRDDYLSNSSDYCWINADPVKPAIWTFLGPVIIILTLNALLLALSMCSLWKTGKALTANEYTVSLMAKNIIKGSVILLPLLGLPWVIGLFAVNSQTTVFAWIFIIVNTLQGFFIFISHIVRNEYVLTKIKNVFHICLPRKRNSAASSIILMIRRKSDNSHVTDMTMVQETQRPYSVRNVLSDMQVHSNVSK